jgi:hypothetical protein
MEKNEFLQRIMDSIDLKVSEILSKKPDEMKFLTFPEFKTITAYTRNVIQTHCKPIPKEVSATCLMAEAVIAPSKKEKITLLKGVISIAGGATGLGLVISGIGTALGWGAGVIAAVCAWFAGINMTPVIGLIVSGLSLAGIAVYFSVATGNPAVASEKAVAALKKGLEGCQNEILRSFSAVDA